MLGILNVTRNTFIYLPSKAGVGGTYASGVLTLAFDTSNHANGDVLQVFYDDAATTQEVSAASLPLPNGAATSANQATTNTSLAAIDAGLGTDGSTPPALPGGSSGVRGWLRYLSSLLPALSGGAWPVVGTFWQAIQPISAASLPLPNGASTSAAQATTNTSLASIDGKAPTLVGGRVPVDASRAFRSVASFTRPANVTAYTAGDVVGDTGGSAILTFSGIGPTAGFIQIQSIRVLISSGTVPTSMTGLRLHLYTASPTAIADNAAWDLVSGDRANYADFIDLPSITDFGSTLYTKVDYPGSLIKLTTGSASLFGLLQTITAATFAENSTVVEVRINAIEVSL